MRADVWAAVLLVAVPVGVQRGVVRGVTVSQPSIEVGAQVDIAVTGVNPCGAVRIDYGDGTERVTHPLSQVPATIQYVYKQPGDFQIRAEGMGNCDGEAATRIRVVQRRDAPATKLRFLEMDANGDGVVTRSEWRGNARSFREYDLNRDGVLSGDELRSPPEPVDTTGGEVIVDPTVRWTATGVYVGEGEIVRVESRGTVQLSADPADKGGPAGVESRRRAPAAPLASRTAGALIARVGDAPPVLVGDARTFRAPASGQLYLGVNDDHLGDNTGEFRVRIDTGQRGRRR